MPYTLRQSKSVKGRRSGERSLFCAGGRKAAGGLYATWFEGVDTGRFRSGVDPAHLLNMIAWMTDGYIHTRRMEGKPLDLEEMMAEVDGWMKLFRAYAYKEEE